MRERRAGGVLGANKCNDSSRIRVGFKVRNSIRVARVIIESATQVAIIMLFEACHSRV